jgi:nucleotidyltransferase substrate binding protein (TIGR01987 family)
MTKQEAQITQLKNAIGRFAEVLSLPQDEMGTVRDSAIQRFEFCVDLSWKTLKTVLKDKHGIECASPKGCVREAFAVGIITEDDPFWLTMIELRNLSAHTYNEETAVLLYEQLPEALKHFEQLLIKLT